MEFTMSDDFDWDNPSTKAVLDIEVFTTKHKEDIWVEFEVTSAKWYERRPPEYASDMIELVGCLTATLSTYYQEHAPDLWEALSHHQKLIQEYQTVAEWLGEEYFHYQELVRSKGEPK